LEKKSGSTTQGIVVGNNADEITRLNYRIKILKRELDASEAENEKLKSKK